MSEEEYERRKGLTFAQAEGLIPLPSQLRRNEISAELRAVLWSAVHNSIERNTDRSTGKIRIPWLTIFKRKHVLYDFRMIDEFSASSHVISGNLKAVFTHGDHAKIYGLIQFIVQQDETPSRFREEIAAYLQYARSSFRLIGGDTLVPIASEEEGRAIARAFQELDQSPALGGPRVHLRNSAEHLTSGSYADSVRESVHAVESAARILAPGTDALSKALAWLEKNAGIHKALKHGFGSIYGFSSDEKGIRHPLLEDGDAKVDETDALFMLGACASFVSYLIGKARAAGLITTADRP